MTSLQDQIYQMQSVKWKIAIVIFAASTMHEVWPNSLDCNEPELAVLHKMLTEKQ